MVMISPLLAGLLLAPAALGAAVPRCLPAQHARREVAAPPTSRPTLRPIRPAQLGALMGARTAANREADAGFVLTDKEELLYGLAAGVYPPLFPPRIYVLTDTAGQDPTPWSWPM